MRRETHGLVTATVVTLIFIAMTVPALAIVYGELDEGRHPFVGSMLFDFDEDGTLDQLCSGTLISSTVFLTASHCTDFLDAAEVGPGGAAVTFDDEIGGGMTVYWGTHYTHPDFGFTGPGGQSDPHDVAVIVFDAPIGISPARLATEGLLDELKVSHELDDTLFTAVGYGTVRESRKKGFGGILDNVERRMAIQSPLSLEKAWFNLSMNEATNNGGTCYGDSGGPHFLGAGGTETTIVVSVTVTGDAVCKATDKTYRVDTPSARGFLGDFVSLP